VVISMDEKIAEGEKLIEQLTADKKALQTALANDSDQRNQASFVNFDEAIVALRVEEIPVKELEITKLKHKVIELKQALDQKLNYEKY
ncbi:hypothetical protein TELCIR_20239, partial [Teladorsagia circumcincta]